MSRFFVPISKEELGAKVLAKLPTDWSGSDVKEAFAKDLKVDFDCENWDSTEADRKGELRLGYQTLDNGLTYWGCCAGGDWQFPVFFLIYWDGKRLRGYVPTNGNPWNTDTNEAYGNDDVADLKNARKRWPRDFASADSVEAGDFEFDWKAIENDVKARIQPKEDKSAPKASSRKPTRPSLADRITSLRYYGTGDEAVELFDATCALCYQMSGLGQEEQARILCGWAEDQAFASQEWWVEGGGSLDDPKADVQKGKWGY